MGELEDRISSVLNDPEQMAQITKLAQGLMGDAGGGAASEMSMLTSVGSGGDKQALLNAMKPYLSEKRRLKLDKAMKLAKLAGFAKAAVKSMEAGDV